MRASPISKTAQAIEKLQALGKHIIFVTNNSMYSREVYLPLFRKIAGFDFDIESIFGVSYATAFYLKYVCNVGTRHVYAIGSKGLGRELELAGINHSGIGPDPGPVVSTPQDLREKIVLERDVGAVVVGFDEHFSYNKLLRAGSHLINPECHYIATNHIEGGVLLSPDMKMPMPGALVTAVNKVSKREPQIIGKPHNHMFQCILTKFPKIDKSKCIMIGDSLKADIGFAKTIGIDSVLVLSGTSSLQDVNDNQVSSDSYTRTLVPDYYVTSLSHLGTIL